MPFKFTRPPRASYKPRCYLQSCATFGEPVPWVDSPFVETQQCEREDGEPPCEMKTCETGWADMKIFPPKVQQTCGSALLHMTLARDSRPSVQPGPTKLGPAITVVP
jgi:hypothetical protein